MKVKKSEGIELIKILKDNGLEVKISENGMPDLNIYLNTPNFEKVRTIVNTWYFRHHLIN